MKGGHPAQTTMFGRRVAVRTLKSAGFDDVQAKAIVDVVLRSGGENVATKADLAAAIGKLRAECTVRPSGRLATADEKRREKVPDLCRAALRVGIRTGLGVGFCIVIGPLYPRLLMGFNVVMLGLFIALVTGVVNPPGTKRFSELQEKRLRRNYR